MDNVNKKSIFRAFNKLFEYKEKQEYDFVIPENDNEEMDKNISYEDEQNFNNPANEPKNIFPSLSVNLEYMKVRYNALINSDIIIREFTLTARNKQYNAFLFYIEGMVNAQIINDFVLNPLMLRNKANMFDGDENRVVKEAITNNISVRRVKKFNF